VDRGRGALRGVQRRGPRRHQRDEEVNFLKHNRHCGRCLPAVPPTPPRSPSRTCTLRGTATCCRSCRSTAWTRTSAATTTYPPCSLTATPPTSWRAPAP
jgi:hypothetical protein